MTYSIIINYWDLKKYRMVKKVLTTINTYYMAQKKLFMTSALFITQWGLIKIEKMTKQTFWMLKQTKKFN